MNFVKVCDIPYCTEPEIFYWKRIKEGITVRDLRNFASELFGKPDRELTVRDLKLAFLYKFPLWVDIDGSRHYVTVKKYMGEWILSCDCKAWIYNRNGRKCKHTEYVEGILSREQIYLREDNMNDWKPYRFRGMDCLIFRGRPEEFPKGFSFYYLRHDEASWAQPITIEPLVFVNYWGMIGTSSPLNFPSGSGFIELTYEEGEEIANLFA